MLIHDTLHARSVTVNALIGAVFVGNRFDVTDAGDRSDVLEEKECLDAGNTL